MSAVATCSGSYDATPMSLHIANASAASWFTCFAGMMPGLSSSSMSAPSRSFPSRTHCRLRVMPGVSADFAILRPSKRLMSALLPTLGKPMTATRMARGSRSRLARRSLTWAPRRRHAFLISCMPLSLLALKLKMGVSGASAPCAFARATASSTKCPRQSRSALSGAQSLRLNTMTCGLAPIHVGTSGCVVLRGMRASRTSMTTSTQPRYSTSWRSALAMCPGNQWILGRPGESASSSSSVMS
mmetsp:Transcript_9895/g.29098  ORF Transcript_9895/g.29098 Transcript_9895/m.29098 type:complete len:243 (+) Transcript_9895:465-1193(+)